MSDEAARAVLDSILARVTQTGLDEGERVLLQLPPEMAPLLERCAIPHLFDLPVVRALNPEAPPELLDAFTDELVSLPSIRLAGECFKLHDKARTDLFRRWLQPERRATFQDLSRRLVAHYQAEAHAAGARVSDVTELNILFHRVGADPEAGFQAARQSYRAWRGAARYGAAGALVQLISEYEPVLSKAQRACLTLFEAEIARDARDLPRAAELLMPLLGQSLKAELAIQVRLLLSELLRLQHQPSQARTHARQALELAAAAPDAADLKDSIELELGLIARANGDVDTAVQHFTRAIELARATRDRLVQASAHNSIGGLLQKVSPREAIASFEAATMLLTEEGDAERRAQLLNNLGLAYANVGEWDNARRALEQSLEIKRAAGDLRGQALTQLNMARVFRTRGELITARNALTESAQLFEAANDSSNAAAARAELARALIADREDDKVQPEVEAAIVLYLRAGQSDAAAALREEFRILHRLPWKRYVLLALVLLLAFVLLLVLVLVLVQAETPS